MWELGSESYGNIGLHAVQLDYRSSAGRPAAACQDRRVYRRSVVALSSCCFGRSTLLDLIDAMYGAVHKIYNALRGEGG